MEWLLSTNNTVLGPTINLLFVSNICIIQNMCIEKYILTLKWVHMRAKWNYIELWRKMNMILSTDKIWNSFQVSIDEFFFFFLVKTFFGLSESLSLWVPSFVHDTPDMYNMKWKHLFNLISRRYVNSLWVGVSCLVSALIHYYFFFYFPALQGLHSQFKPLSKNPV